MACIKIGMVGVGAISGIYLENLTHLFHEVEIYGVCDLIRARAEKAQADYQIPMLYETMEELFADSAIDIVLNLTRPYEHFAVTKAALLAGKHVYSEKSLGASLAEGEALVALAQEQKRMLGGAPDTFLGAGLQTCRKLIDDGYLGDVIGVSAHMLCHGHESWHPDPDFYYQYGGGPMMDMGPYYITAMVYLLGGVKSVLSVSKTSFAKRVITSAPHAGEVIDVQAPTHITGILNFASGVVGTLTTSFDVYYETQAKFEIYGTAGTLVLPDPNTFGGAVQLLRPEDSGCHTLPLCFPYSGNSRGLGLADMAKALQTGRDFRADYRQTFHVLEVLQTLQAGGSEGKILPITSSYHRPLPLRTEVPGWLV